jgi:hypothetical protein
MLSSWDSHSGSEKKKIEDRYLLLILRWEAQYGLFYFMLSGTTHMCAFNLFVYHIILSLTGYINNKGRKRGERESREDGDYSGTSKAA